MDGNETGSDSPNLSLQFESSLKLIEASQPTFEMTSPSLVLTGGCRVEGDVRRGLVGGRRVEGRRRVAGASGGVGVGVGGAANHLSA